MVEEKFATSQIKRLTGLNFFPTTTEGVKEMVSALRIAPTDQIAKSAVDYFLSNVTECPKPCEIRERAQPLNEDFRRPGPTRCNACGDTGFASRVVMKHGQPYDIAVPCGCESEP